jgi:dGTPase
LGHDLGHVPFGHDGEKELNKICVANGIGAFCHNAQSVRELTLIEKDGLGLNMTLQVIDGILAHNGEVEQKEYHPSLRKNWDEFEIEYNNCMQDTEYSKSIRPMTLEGCVVRISDIIAYLGRDIDQE